jgi:chromosome segregation ATPase
MPPDLLRFEYEKRQREMQTLRQELSSARRELDELYDWYEEDRRSRPGAYNAAGTEPSGLHDIPRQMDRIEAKLRDLEGELETVQLAIDVKWK